MFGAKKKKFLELSIYDAKIPKEDYEKFFNNLIKRRVPFLGLIDFSDILTLRGVPIVFKRYNNTIKIFIEDRDNLYSQSSLLFPFRMDVVSKEVEFLKSHLWPGYYFVPSGNFFDFFIKEKIEEIRISIKKAFGSFYAMGTTVDAKGRSRGILILNPTAFFAIDLEHNPVFYIELLDPIPKAVYVNSGEPIFTSESARIGTDNFSALQHSLIVGTSGTGKSKLLEILIRAVKKRHGDVNILVIDPHAEFSKTFENEKVIDFVHNYVEPLDVGVEKSPLITQLVAQLITSTIAQESKYAERITFYSVHLLASINELTLQNLNLLLTDSTKRTEFASRCDNDEVRRFFDEEFQDIYMHHFNDAILPVINFIGEYLLYIGKEKKLENVGDLLNKHQLVVVSFNPHFFGRKIIKFFAGAIINQMYMLAISEKLKRPTVLVVDEFPVVESKVVKDILAETRKFNLYVYVSGQYLGQISKIVLDSIISNVRNIISFRVTREDAKILVSMMEIKVEEFFKKKVSPSELEESKKEMFLKLHPRECIVRLFDGSKYILPMKVKTVDASVWGVDVPHPKTESEQKWIDEQNKIEAKQLKAHQAQPEKADGSEQEKPGEKTGQSNMAEEVNTESVDKQEFQDMRPQMAQEPEGIMKDDEEINDEDNSKIRFQQEKEDDEELVPEEDEKEVEAVAPEGEESPEEQQIEDGEAGEGEKNVEKGHMKNYIERIHARKAEEEEAIGEIKKRGKKSSKKLINEEPDDSESKSRKGKKTKGKKTPAKKKLKKA
ncbi:DUF87 domain-containing protein [Candidatus Parvarchaeota archaeon]|nr:DUF87 domain-containing protein [Candidatus Parvarchaeota archaeon]